MNSARTSTTAASPPAPSVPALRRWSSRIGAVAMAGVGTAHLVANVQAYAAGYETSWLLLVLYGCGVALLAFVIAGLAWRHGSRTTPGPRLPTRIVLALGGVLLCVGAGTLLINNPQLIIDPLGPGPWSTIGGPALLVAAVSPPLRRVR